MGTVNYTISEETRRFLDALNAFQEFKDNFLNALEHQYGEEQGKQFYDAETERYDKIEHTIWEYMRANVTSGMGMGCKNVEI